MAFHPKKAFLALVAAAGLFAVPADAAFSNASLNDFVDLVNAQELDAAQTKAVAKINALEAKEYTAFSKELGAASACVKAATKPFANNTAVSDAIADLATTEGGIDSLYFQLLGGETGTLAAQAKSLQIFSDPIKAGKVVYAKIAKHLIKADAATDPAKRIKFWSKMAKGAEWFHAKAPGDL